MIEKTSINILFAVILATLYLSNFLNNIFTVIHIKG